MASFLVAFVAGCDDSPVTQMDEGKSTLKSAQLAEAELYAPELYKMAMDSLSAAEVEIQKQDGKFSVLRDYDRAKELIAAVSKISLDAEQKAIAEKDRVRVADSVLIVEIDALIAESSTALAKAPKVKGSRVDLKVLQADIDAVKGALTTATQTYQSGAFSSAKSQLEAVKAQITGTKSQIEAAITSGAKKK